MEGDPPFPHQGNPEPSPGLFLGYVPVFIQIFFGPANYSICLLQNFMGTKVYQGAASIFRKGTSLPLPTPSPIGENQVIKAGSESYFFCSMKSDGLLSH